MNINDQVELLVKAQTSHSDTLESEFLAKSKVVTRGGVQVYADGKHAGKVVGTVRGRGSSKPETQKQVVMGTTGYTRIKEGASIDSIVEDWQQGKKGRDPEIPADPNASWQVFTHGEWDASEIHKHSEYDRSNKENTQSIKADMQANGFDKTKFVVMSIYKDKAVLTEGNHRLQAATELGIKKVPVVFAFKNSNYGDK